MLVGIRETIERRTLDVVERDYPKATLDSSFMDLGMDSLDYVSFLVAIEEEFRRDLPKNAVFLTPHDIVQYLEGKWSSK